MAPTNVMKITIISIRQRFEHDGENGFGGFHSVYPNLFSETKTNRNTWRSGTNLYPIDMNSYTVYSCNGFCKMNVSDHWKLKHVGRKSSVLSPGVEDARLKGKRVSWFSFSVAKPILRIKNGQKCIKIRYQSISNQQDFKHGLWF